MKDVIYGMSVKMSEEEIKNNMSGAKVIQARRLPYVRNGVKNDSLSVMLQFQGEILPSRVMVGFMSYIVREYVPPLLRCYKCQRYGHVGAVCEGKQRCGKCGGEHKYTVKHTVKGISIR